MGTTSSAVDLAGMSLTKLFQLYIVAEKHSSDGLQNKIVDMVYTKLQTDADVLATIGLDSEAFHEFKINMPSSSLLYKLILRSMAVLMLLPPGTIAEADHEDGDFCPTAGERTWQPHQLGGFLEKVPDELLRPFLGEILHVKTLSRRARNCKTFGDLVGPRAEFFMTEEAVVSGWLSR